MKQSFAVLAVAIPLGMSTAVARAEPVTLGTAAPAANGVDVNEATKGVPCTIEEIFSKHAAATKAQADALRDRKRQELVDPENRADRAKNRLEHGDEISVEGGSTRHRIAFDVPKIRMHRVSFDIPETFMGDAKMEVPDGLKECWWKVGPIKTKGLCAHTKIVVVGVPQFRSKTVSFDLPDTVEWQRVDIVYDTLTVTQRDNRHDLNTANGNIQRIKRELEDGSKAIQDRTSAEFFDEAGKAIDKAEQSALAEFDKQVRERLSSLAQIRSDLESKRSAARAAAGDKAGEVDAAFTKAAAPIDRMEAVARAKVEEDRKSITQQFAILRDDLNKSRLACVKNS